MPPAIPLAIEAAAYSPQDQPLLRMPYELSRRNFKNAQRVIEHSSANVTSSLTAATKASKTASPDATLDSLDSMISKMQNLKRKVEGLHDEEMRIHKSAKARLRHLQDLYDIHSLVDVKYDEWSRTRLSRLLVDYLLREGYSESAAHLAQSKGITDLVDVDAFVACHKIERSLREGMSTSLALDWCKEHGKELKKAGSILEFELRLQQYIELVRQGHEAGMSGMDGIESDGTNGVSIGGGGGETKLVEARAHAKKFLSTNGDFDLLRRAAGLLAYKPWDEVEPYAVSCFAASSSDTTNQLSVALFAFTLGLSSNDIPLHTSQPLLAPTSAAPAYCAICWSLRTEDPRMSFGLHFLLGQRVFVHHRRLPDLQH
jgi:macrophage erythroblast attacher